MFREWLCQLREREKGLKWRSANVPLFARGTPPDASVVADTEVLDAAVVVSEQAGEVGGPPYRAAFPWGGCRGIRTTGVALLITHIIRLVVRAPPCAVAGTVAQRLDAPTSLVEGSPGSDHCAVDHAWLARPCVLRSVSPVSPLTPWGSQGCGQTLLASGLLLLHSSQSAASLAHVDRAAGRTVSGAVTAALAAKLPAAVPVGEGAVPWVRPVAQEARGTTLYRLWVLLLLTAGLGPAHVTDSAGRAVVSPVAVARALPEVAASLA